MNVSEIMSKDFVRMKPDDTIQSFISEMEKHHIHSAPVVDDKDKLLGNIDYKKLAAKGVIDPSSEKIRSMMDSPPPTLKKDSTIEAAADMIFKTGLRALPVVENNKVISVVSVWDIMKYAANTKNFKQMAAERIMAAAEVIDQNEEIGKARVIMRERGISRLPVVNQTGKLTGVITTFDMLRSIKPRERQAFMAAEVDRIMALPVNTVMNKRPVTTGPKTNLSELAQMMVNNKTSGVIVTIDDAPVGVVTTKDMLEVYVSSFAQKGVYYQTIGLEEEDDDTTATIDRMIRDTLQKISSVVPLQFFFLHVKHHNASGLRIKYSVRARLRTDSGFFIAKAVEWDARDAVGAALENLEHILLKKKNENATRVHKDARKAKQLKHREQ